MTLDAFALVTESEEETAELGRAIGAWLQDGDVLLLHGDLGAGKTVLAKGIAVALGIDAVLSSPSFALVNEYDAGLLAPVSRLYHIDLFRLSDASDLASIGYDDLIAPVDAVTLVEWPERAAETLPDRFILIAFDPAGEGRRHITITPFPQNGLLRDRYPDLRGRLAGRWRRRPVASPSKRPT